jgi:DNA modification methylase
MVCFHILNNLETIFKEKVLEDLKKRASCSINTTFSDFPYFLGTEWHFVDGKLQMKGQGKDFMHGSAGSWSVNNADWWREYFAELHRCMKFGGYVLFFSISQQSDVFSVLMREAGFEKCAENADGYTLPSMLHWAVLGNFPKSTDASKSVDSRLGAEREVVGKNKCGKTAMLGKMNDNIVTGSFNITAPATDLAKLLEGFKYGRAPLKKITEPLLIFRKAPKNGSVLNDLMACQTDPQISPAILDIENNRVGIETIITQGGDKNGKHNVYNKIPDFVETSHTGRFPATLILSNGAADLLDSQLDLITFELNNKLFTKTPRKEYERIVWQATQNNELQTLKVLHTERQIMVTKESERTNSQSPNGVYGKYNTFTSKINGDSGFISRIMHRADFTQDDFDSYANALNAYEAGLVEDTFYQPTVSPKERHKGCEHLLYSGIQEMFVTRTNPKNGKQTRNKIAFDSILEAYENFESLQFNSPKELSKNIATTFFAVIVSQFETEINETNFVEICNSLTEIQDADFGIGITKISEGNFSISIKGNLFGISISNTIRQGNGHVSLKPISLVQKLISLFKLPKGFEQILYVPFSGSGSEVIGAIQAGYDPQNIISVEINPQYVAIQKARLAYYANLQNIPLPKEVQSENIKPKAQNSLF